MSLKGIFSPPGDKSISHRIALVSLLGRGSTRVTNLAGGEDVRSSLGAVQRLGVRVVDRPEGIQISGIAGRTESKAVIDCGNSGTTTRLLMGILAGRDGVFILDGDASLRKRPMERVAAPLGQMGAVVNCTEGKCPVTVHGGHLAGIDYHPPVASAQLKSAVLLAGIQAQGRTTVHEFAFSRDHTELMLQAMGADILAQPGSISVGPSTLIMPESFRVPGDASSAAFFLCAAAILPGSEVTASGMLLNPTRTGFLSTLKRMGVVIEVEPENDRVEPSGNVRIRYTPDLLACEVGADEIPSLVDEVPILALTATQATGVTIFRQVGELRVKETDRLAAITSQLNRMGANIRIVGDDLHVEGPTRLSCPPELESFGDHRMAMTLRLAGLLTGGSPRINDEACAAISYPEFARTLEGLIR
nr:3-phosphoshikimate 1-carboxyvinyltransferase [uncultured Sphaerochaeta sp.]